MPTKEQILRQKLLDLREKAAEINDELEAIAADKAKGRWRPDIVDDEEVGENTAEDEYYFVYEDGSVGGSQDSDKLEQFFEQGNVFKTRKQAEHASVLMRSLFIQLQYAFTAGGDALTKRGTYVLGHGAVLPAKGPPFPTMVYMPSQKIAEQAWNAMMENKTLFPVYPAARRAKK